MFDHTPRYRRIVYGMAYLTLGIGFLTAFLIGGYYFYLTQRPGTSCEEWLVEQIQPLAYESKVQQVTERADCRYEIELDIPVPSYFLVCQCRENNNLASWIRSGDSIFKKSGEMTLSVKRENTMRIFTYPCCE
ncbi:MAG: hypothetical protein AAFR59_13085 [Bacteroidota bacterium]